jgi:hypothetical protein
MPLRISCPEGHTLVVSQARAGQTLRCPKCNARIVVPPPAPSRNVSLVDVAMSALADEPEKPLAAAAVLDEPVPPPVAIPPAEVTPPPVWSPPPKSRAIVEPPVEDKRAEPIPAEVPVPALEQERKPVSQPVDVPSTEPPIKPEIVAEVTEIPVPPDTGREPIPASALSDGKSLGPESTEGPVVDPPESAEGSIVETPPLVPAPGQQLGAYVLALSLAAAALFGAAPAIWDVIQFAQAAENAFVPRWALALLSLGILQGAYALYLAQLPDWASGWVVTLVSLALAALYAGMLGITLLASGESILIRGLDLAEVLPTGRAAMWCLCMTSIMASLAFFAGRTSLRWRRAEAL